MDNRVALKQGAVLRLGSEQKEYVIRGELSRGGSSIVYDACYQNQMGQKKSVRIKECYPLKVNLTRKNTVLIAKENEERFLLEKERFRSSFCVLNLIREGEQLTNSIVDSYDIYEANGTLYSVMDYKSGCDLSKAAFNKMSDVIKVICSITRVVNKIHEAGYLYLDLKPENVFVYHETYEMVCFFDFDSMISMKDIEAANDVMVSYTAGFSSVEQRRGDVRHLGVWSDVYAIGALLFYLIFGRTPKAPDCMDDSKYDFDKSNFATNRYQNKFYDMLTQFFNKTLNNYYSERISNVTELGAMLNTLLELSDEKKAYIISSGISKPDYVVGRESEISEVETWYGSDSNILFITGLGGIGKSTLIRESICRAREKFDVILYINMKHTVMESIVDDNQVKINTFAKHDEETVKEYFERKVSFIREYAQSHQVLIVFDDYADIKYKGIRNIAEIGAKVIVISRQEYVPGYGKRMSIAPLKSKEDLYDLFRKNLGRNFSEEEREQVDHILVFVQNHTLSIELIANQVRRSYLDLQEAVELLKEHGFSEMAPEKVRFTKDGDVQYGKMSELFTALYDAGNMSEEKRRIVKVLTIFGYPGINIREYGRLLNLSTLDDINELVDLGWLKVDDRQLIFHPVIFETILNWKWNSSQIDDAKAVMAGVLSELPTKTSYIQYGEEIVHCCYDKKNFECREYYELTYKMIDVIGIDKERFILQYGAAVLTEFENEQRMLILDKMAYIYNARGKFTESKRILNVARNYAEKRNDFVKGLYYEMLGDYYDAVLNGIFISNDRDERQIIRASMKNLDRCIECMRKSNNLEAKGHLLKNLCAKMTYLIRSYPINRPGFFEKQQIDKIDKECVSLILQNQSENTEETFSYYMSKAWYYCYVKPNPHKANRYVKTAYGIIKHIYHTDADLINFMFMPAANIFMELGISDTARKWMEQAIKRCDKHEADEVYQRKKTELLKCMQDIEKNR